MVKKLPHRQLFPTKSANFTFTKNIESLKVFTKNHQKF